MYAHLNAPVPDARELNDRVPDALAELAMQAMAKEPDARVHSASELAERLVEAADTRESPAPATLPATPPIPAAPTDAAGRAAATRAGGHRAGGGDRAGGHRAGADGAGGDGAGEPTEPAGASTAGI